MIKAVNAGTDLLVFSNVKARDTELGAENPCGHRRCGARRAHLRARIEKAYGKIAALKRRGLKQKQDSQRQVGEKLRRASVIGVVLGRVPEHVIGIGGVAQDDGQEGDRAIQHKELASGAAAACQIVMSGGMI